MRGFSVGSWVLVALVVVLLDQGLNAERLYAKGPGRKQHHLPEGDGDSRDLKEQEEGENFGDARSSARIVNGELENLIWRARYVAQIHKRRFGLSFEPICTAVIVHKNVVMTTAHCFDELDGPETPIPSDYRVCANSLTWDFTYNSTAICYTATDIRIPDAYVSGVTHDIALVKVGDRPLGGKKGERVVQVDLAPIAIKPKEQPGMIYGFGDVYSNSYNDGRLRKVDVVWSRYDRCVDDNSVIGTHLICTDGNYDGSMGGTCHGDSGGPLTWSKDGSNHPQMQVLVGIVSFGDAFCRPEYRSGITRIGAWPISTWLRQTMKSLGGHFRVYKGPATR